jgi:hypothetical protein
MHSVLTRENPRLFIYTQTQQLSSNSKQDKTAGAAYGRQNQNLLSAELLGKTIGVQTGGLKNSVSTRRDANRRELSPYRASRQYLFILSKLVANKKTFLLIAEI